MPVRVTPMKWYIHFSSSCELIKTSSQAIGVTRSRRSGRLSWRWAYGSSVLSSLSESPGPGTRQKRWRKGIHASELCDLVLSTVAAQSPSYHSARERPWPVSSFSL